MSAIAKKQDRFFRELYDDTYYILKREAYYMVRDEEAVHDILQETFLEAYNKIDVLSKHNNPKGWLVNTVKYKAMPYRKKMSERLKKEVQLEFDGEEFEFEVLSKVDEYPFLIFDFLEAALKKEEYEMVIKRVLGGLSFKELADEYNISEGACKMRVKRSLLKLREVLSNSLIIALVYWLVKK